MSCCSACAAPHAPHRCSVCHSLQACSGAFARLPRLPVRLCALLRRRRSQRVCTNRLARASRAPRQHGMRFLARTSSLEILPSDGASMISTLEELQSLDVPLDMALDVPLADDQGMVALLDVRGAPCPSCRRLRRSQAAQCLEELTAHRRADGGSAAAALRSRVTQPCCGRSGKPPTVSRIK